MSLRLEPSTVLARAENADFSQEELSTAGGLVVSFVDGVSNLGLVATRTKLSVERVLAEAERLVERSLLVVVSRPGASGAHYDLSELEEDVDLDRVRRRLVLETYHSLDRMSYYELLEVHPDADRTTIKKAYFRLSKIFHPDTLYGKNLGSYRPKMEAVFQRMTRAYDVLGKAKSRAEYDAKLGEEYLSRLRTRMVSMLATEPPSSGREPVTVPSATPAPRAEATPAPRAQSPSGTPRGEASPTSVPPRSGAPSSARPTPLDDAERRRRLAAARLAGVFGGARSTGSRPAATPAPAPSERRTPIDPSQRRAVAEELAQSVRRSTAVTGSNPRLAAMLSAAHAAESAGRYEEALSHLAAAQAEAPERTDIGERIERVRRAMAAAHVQEHRRRAETLRAAGRLREAAFAYRDVALGAPDDAAAHIAAAECLRSMEEPDLRLARDYARRAIELQPTRVETHLLLAQIYLDAGMTHNAIRAFESAESVDPASPAVAAFRDKLGA